MPLSLQTQQILSARIQEEMEIVLSISVYDVARNEEARQHRQELVTLHYYAFSSLIVQSPSHTGEEHGRRGTNS